MAFPSIRSLSRGSGTAVTQCDMTLPATINAGDRVVMFLAVAEHSVVVMTPNTAGAWTLHQSAAVSGVGFYLYDLVATGGEGSSAEAAEVDGSTDYAYHIYAVADFTSAAYVPPATGTSTSPDPPDNDPAGGAADTLWLIAGAFDNKPGVTSHPTNYTTNGISDESPSSETGACTLASSYRTANATSENPGAWTIGASQQWVAFTAAFVGADGGGPGPILRPPHAAFQHMMIR